MQKIESSAQLAQWQARRGRKSVALVATMGNLHDGHLALVRRAQTIAELTVVSIYVNPVQFGPEEDFASYPRTLETDCHKLSALGVDMVFLPQRQMIYPFPATESITFRLPDSYARILCGRGRSGHFAGVVAVVTRLFHLLDPQVAVFGAKDYQQQWIIRKMVHDLHFPVAIETVATVREANGLACSSRNQYLSSDESHLAAAIYQTLTSAGDRIRRGENIDKTVITAKNTLATAGLTVEYLDCRDRETLQPATEFDRAIALFVAARLGKTRLIDNLLLEAPPR